MRSGRLSSTSASSSTSSSVVFVFVLTIVLPTTLAITTTHHDKPEESQPIQMASKMRVSDPLAIADLNANSSNTETSERQKRLLPYMTFYLEQDFNRPQQLPPITPTNYATTGAVKQPTILQQYHNKFTELTNGISYQPAANKVRLTPFSHSNALPGPFLPMRNPPAGVAHVQIQVQPQLQPPTQPPITSGASGSGAAKKQPNYSAIYDKLSQLKLQQQYQLAQTYTRQYPPQQVLQLQVAHPLHSPNSYRKPPPPPSPQQQVQVQQVSYIPIRDYSQLGHKQSPAKTIVQTYTPSSIDVPSPSYGGDDEEGNAVADEDGLREEDDDARYEPEHVLQHQHQHHHHHVSLPVKSYNEPVKHYGVRVQAQPQNADEFPKFPVAVKKHVLKPVVLVRQKPTANNPGKPYLILQRKPTPLPVTPHKPYDYELQIPETINFRPIKFNYPPAVAKYQHQQQPHAEQQEEVEKIVVESVTPKYIDIVPKYEVKPTILTYSQNYGKPYKYSVQESGPSASAPSAPPSPIRTVLPQDLSHSAPHIPQPPLPATPHPHIISYQRPIPTHHTEQPQEQGDYVDTEDIKYQKPKYRPTVQLEYADELSEDEVAPITTRAPEPVYHQPSGGKFSHAQDTHDSTNYVKQPAYVTTPLPYPTEIVFAPTAPTKPASVHQAPPEPDASTEHEPEYQEGANSLSLILKKLQDTNALPQTLTPENIDNSIRTLVKILSGLKKTPKFQRPIVVQDDSGDYEGNNEAGVGLGEVPGTVTQIFPENTPEGGTPGTPGVDYPALSSIPQTSFNCKTQRYKGFFGDPDTHCQVWHYCDLNGGQASFLCPNGTIFSQVALTCDWWYNVKCSNTAQLYVLNERLYKYILPLSPKFPEDYSGPLVDRYLALKFQEMEEKMKKERKPNKENSSDEDSRATTINSKATDEAASASSSRENETIQDDAEELSKETRRHEASLLGSTAAPTRSAPIVVPDESNETTTSTEDEDAS